jgi:hypothetical protein
MTGARRGQCQFLLVAALANCVLAQRDFEVMRGVTALTECAAVKGVIGCGLSMATAARLRHELCLLARGMRRVTGDAAARARALWVVGVDVAVAVHAGKRRALSNVVRLVTAGAARVRGDRGFGKYDQATVAGATRNSLFCREFVRPVAIHAGAVTPGEERARRHDRLHLAMTRRARRERIRGWSMLMRMTCPTGLVARFALCVVGRDDSAVAARAISRDRLRILMRVMAVQATGRGVYGHGWDLSLCPVVAARAIAWLEGVDRARARRFLVASVVRERVAVRAIGVYS